MTKIKITADAVLAIVRSIFDDEDVNAVISDASAPSGWRGKTVQEVLNVEYYTFKHRPISTEQLIAEKIKENQSANTLAALNRSFCILSLENIERIYSKDTDTAVVSAAMEYWVQTGKIKLLEELIEDCNIALSGIRIPVIFDGQTRKAVVMFSPLNVVDIQTGTVCGEMAVCEIEIRLLFYSDVSSYSDYEVSFTFLNAAGDIENCVVPLSNFSYVNTMTQKSAPRMNDVRKVGNINLSRATSFVLVFEGYSNPFIDYVTDRALRGDILPDEPNNPAELDNNETLIMTVKRGEISYRHEVVIKDHQITVNADTGNETHTLSLVTRGI
jgi:hypothetical protein